MSTGLTERLRLIHRSEKINGELIYITWSDHVSLVLFETLKGVDSSLQSTSHHAQFDWAVSWI